MNLKGKTLVIVDMQPHFPASLSKATIEGVLHEIRKAKRRKAGIVVVRFEDCGPVNDKIDKAVKNYPHVSRIQKDVLDGSREVLRAVKRRKFNPYRFVVCGVNTTQCVLETVVGMTRTIPAHGIIEVAKKACNDGYDGRSHRTWKQFREYLSDDVPAPERQKQVCVI